MGTALAAIASVGMSYSVVAAGALIGCNFGSFQITPQMDLDRKIATIAFYTLAGASVLFALRLTGTGLSALRG